MLRARMTLPHFSVSSAMNFPNAADVIDIGSTPNPASRAFMTGSAAMALISLLSLSITAVLCWADRYPRGEHGHFFQRHEGFGKHLTAVDDKRLARDVGCLLARKEECRVRYVFCGSEPPHRDGRLHFRDVRRTKSAQSFGRYVPRQDGVDRHAERCELNGRGANETQLPGLARPVMRPSRITRDRASDGGCHDYAAPGLFQFRQAYARGENSFMQKCERDA